MDIMFPLMYNSDPQLRLQVVHYYLKNNSSMRKTAAKFNVNYRSVFKWVKWHKEQGERRLLSTYKRSWRRAERKLEERLVFMKEADPGLTIRNAQKILEMEGINISIKGIWGIWKRRGYAGLVKKSLSTDFRSCIPVSHETMEGIRIAEEFSKQNDIFLAAKVLNDLPSCPKNELLKKIPDRFLTAHRKLEKYYSLWGEIPYPMLSQKLRRLREKFENEGHTYSVMRAGILESLALEWSGETQKQLDLFIHLGKTCQKKELDPALRFVYHLAEGSAHLRNLNVKKALHSLGECETLIKLLPRQSFLPSLLALYGNFGYYRKLKRLLYQHEAELERDTLLLWQARLFATEGRYAEYRSFLGKMKERKEDPADILQNAQYLFFEKGESQKAMDKVNLFFGTAKKMAIRTYWDFVSVFLATLYSAQGEKDKGFFLIKRSLSLLRKLGNKKNVLFNEIIVSDPELPEYADKINHFRLLFLLKNASLTKREIDYRKAFEYARREGLLGSFHRFSILFPEAIQNLLDEGENTELPKTLLRLPVFNKEMLVYHVRFLGPITVCRNKKILKVKLKPKDRAFIIFLCSNVKERGKSIRLDEIYVNFWPGSQNPSHNLSHLLVRIKKSLKIPAYLLAMSKKYGFLNEGIYFTTDYQEFEQILVQARALERAGEWGFARREYLRAFKLFRGEPFKKNYDEWSLNMRHRILTQLETEATNFARGCLAHKNMRDAKKVLEKVSKIIPESEEIRNLVNGN